MRRHIKLWATGVAVVLTMGMLTGCTSKEQEKAAAKYQKEAENYAAGNNYEAAQKSMKKALEQTPKDADLKKAAEKLDKEAKEKAANFLYLIIKNHVFIDGNKRIAATLFIYFLEKFSQL